MKQYKMFAIIVWIAALSFVENMMALAQWSHDPNVSNAISIAANNQGYPTLTSDGAGGAIITWFDSRSGSADIYVQRINASGVVQWTTDGIAICTAAGSQEYPKIVSDGAGGAIIMWIDRRSGSADIYAQRINASGVAQWTANGVPISTVANDKVESTIESDGVGGAIITWIDNLSGTHFDIYAQRINAAGVLVAIARHKK